MFKFLAKPIHPNKFSKAFQISEESKGNYQFSFDGSIVAVRADIVESYLKRDDVRSMKFGYTKLPKTMKLESESDLLQIISTFYIDEEESED
jgi:hypothetical protein